MPRPPSLRAPYKRFINVARERTRTEAMSLRVRDDVARQLELLYATGEARPLPEKTRRLIRDYAAEAFGDARFAPWLEFYAIWNGGAFREGWTPEDYLQSVAMPYLNGAYHKLCQARTLQRRLLDTPSMPDIAYFIGGSWYDLSGAPIGRGCVPAMLFAEADEVCVKAEHTIWGRGVSFETRADFDIDRVERNGNVVVQRVIRQSDWFERLSPRAVATIRVATGRIEGARPHLVGAFLRVGYGTARAIGLDSMDVPVADAGGALIGYGIDADWRRAPAHPETGVAFAGLRIPDFDRAVAHCLDLHLRLPQFGFIGWDVAVDRQGAVQVMEFNTAHPETKTLEMTVGPCFRAFDLGRYKDMKRKDVWA